MLGQLFEPRVIVCVVLYKVWILGEIFVPPFPRGEKGRSYSDVFDTPDHLDLILEDSKFLFIYSRKSMWYVTIYAVNVDAEFKTTCRRVRGKVRCGSSISKLTLGASYHHLQAEQRVPNARINIAIYRA